MSFFTHVVSWANERRPDELLVLVLAAALAFFTVWCLSTWVVAQFNLDAAIAIAPPLMRAALVAGFLISVTPAAHASDSPIDAINGLALPERPEVIESTSTPTPTPSSQQTPSRGSTQSPSPTPTSRGSASESQPAPKPSTGQTSGANPSQTTDSNRTTDTAQNTATTSTTYTVNPGDFLWKIAATSLGDAPSNHEISAAVDRWHHVNHDVIGTNPNLIHPGQELKEPHS